MGVRRATVRSARTLGFPFAALLAAALGAGAPALAIDPYDTCDAEIETILAEQGLGEDVVRSIYVSPRILSSRRGDKIAGIDVWVRLKGCAGALIVDFTPYCGVTQVYTRGDCKLPGVSAY